MMLFENTGGIILLNFEEGTRSQK